MTDEEKVLRGRRAQRYLSDPFWNEMRETLEQKHIEGMIEGKTPEIRDGHRQAIFAIREVIEELSAYVGDAQMLGTTQ